MKASVLQRMRWAQWFGPNGSNSLFTPYALSQPVPGDEYWRVLAVSITDPAGLSNQTAFLYALPGPIAEFFSGNNIILPYLTDNPPYSPGSHDLPPSTKGVMVGNGGGRGGVNVTHEIQMLPSSGVSINPLFTPFGMTRRGIRRLTLSPGWGLLAVQDLNGGGGAIKGLRLSIAYIPFKVGECPNEADSAARFANVGNQFISRGSVGKFV